MLLHATFVVSMPYSTATIPANAHKSALDFPDANNDWPRHGGP